MHPILIAAFNFGAMADPITDPAGHPLGAAGWLVGVYAVLRIIWANYKDQLPTFLATILSKIPGFGPFAPAIAPSIAAVIQQLVEQLLAKGVPPEQVAAIAGQITKQVVPMVNEADAAVITKQVHEKCGIKPEPAPGA